MKKTRELKPIKETPRDYEAIEKEILRILRTEIFLPIVAALGVKASKVLRN